MCILQQTSGPIVLLRRGWKETLLFETQRNIPTQGTTVPSHMNGKEMKEKMDFWGTAKNKDNKSADHEGMTQLIAAKRMRERSSDNGEDS